LPSFLAGIVIAIIIVRYKIYLSSVWPGTVTFMSAIFFLIIGGNHYLVLGLFVLTVALTAMGEKGGAHSILQSRICRTLGDVSYSIYMIHPLVSGVMLAIVWRHFHGSDFFPFEIYCGFVALLVVGLAIVTYSLFEKPMRERFSTKPATNAGPILSAVVQAGKNLDVQSLTVHHSG
jgi:peptidoglycan/LPS O-acetylase OafA/YrhL